MTKIDSLVLWAASAIILTRLIVPVDAAKCFTCEGACYSKRFCNCQTGICEGDYCYTERRPNPKALGHDSYRIEKGCMRNPPKQELTCDYDRYKGRVFCLCKGDFCNADIRGVRNERSRPHNTTCYQCPRNSASCSSTCRGDYCFKDLRNGAQDCGYGPPYLAYTYRLNNILHNYRQEYCVSEETGTMWGAQCVCRGNLCNTHVKRREKSQLLQEQYQELYPQKKLHMCYSCRKQDVNGVMPTQCDKEHASQHNNQIDYCLGQYCTVRVTTQKEGALPTFTRIAGCLNSTAFGGIHLGCSQKWLLEKNEVVACACKGDYCNSDLGTANKNGVSGSNLVLGRKNLVHKVTVISLMFVLMLRYNSF